MTSIYLLSIVGNDIRLLETWLQYYADFNFDGIFLSLQVRDENDERLVRKVEALAALHGAVVSDYHRSPEYQQAERLARLQAKCCGPDDWFVVADIDEFVEFTDRPGALVETCRNEGCDFVGGIFLDRLGIHGSLPSLDGLAYRSLWDLFPLGCHLTRDIALATDRKVVLASCPTKVGYGQHSASGTRLPTERGTAFVHHFKWDERVVERTRYMLWMYAMQGEPWVVERLRTLRYLERQGISDQSAALAAFWPRYRRTTPIAATCGTELDDSIDLPYAVPRKLCYPTNAFVTTLDAPEERLDVSRVIRLLFDNINGVKTVGQTTERLYEILQPDGLQYLSLEPWIQNVIRRLCGAGYMEIVSET